MKSACVGILSIIEVEFSLVSYFR